LTRLGQSTEQARERLEAIRRNIAAAEIRARSPGIVVGQEISDPLTGPRKVQVGDQVFPGQPLVTLPDVSEMDARFQVRETDVHHLRLGLPARVVVRAYPGLELPARVSLLGTLAREPGPGGGEKTFQVTARLERSDERLRPGMTVRVEVLVDRVEGALLVPLPAVFSRPGGSFCYVERRLGGWGEREVKTGLAGAERIQVLEGLSEGERVSLAVPHGS
jgi:RND family efflux transporter MFP subunit